MFPEGSGAADFRGTSATATEESRFELSGEGAPHLGPKGLIVHLKITQGMCLIWEAHHSHFQLPRVIPDVPAPKGRKKLEQLGQAA